MKQLTTTLAVRHYFGIHNLVYDNYKTGILNFPDSLPKKKLFYIDLRLSENEKQEWRQFFKDNELEFITYDQKDYEKLNPAMNQFNYAVHAVTILPILEIEESMNTFEYIEVWQSRYIWLFFDWIKIEKTIIAQS